MSSFSSFLTSQFSAPLHHPTLNLIKHLKSQHPESQHLSVEKHAEFQFPILDYLKATSIEFTYLKQDTHATIDHTNENIELYDEIIAGTVEFTYESVAYRLYKLHWTDNDGSPYLWHLAFDGDDDSAGRKLIREVYRWANKSDGEIWVYDQVWTKDKALYDAVQMASWDEVILDDTFKENLRRDTKIFFSSKEIYASLGITWKRGLLLLGPPGNGKTESIKALLAETKATPLYVKSFDSCGGGEQGIRFIFQHARDHAPCILILEDLDSMVTPELRSFFLNELDGLAQNDGVLTVATTNHPERIDDAILNRPSRFDVKYTFPLPTLALRKEFSLRWLAKINKLGPSSGAIFERGDEDIATDIAERTDGWSFAFLKELFVSFLLRLAHDRSLSGAGSQVQPEKPGTLLLQQLAALATQILKAKEEVTE